MALLDGKVAVITGAGRGIGREEALLMAKHGAKIVVNDLGGHFDGTGQSRSPAEDVVKEIRAAGGEAVANFESVTDFKAAKRIIECATDNFGKLNISATKPSAPIITSANRRRTARSSRNIAKNRIGLRGNKKLVRWR